MLAEQGEVTNRSERTLKCVAIIVVVVSNINLPLSVKEGLNCECCISIQNMLFLAMEI